MVFVFPGERAVGPLGAIARLLAFVDAEGWIGEGGGFMLEAFGEVFGQEMSERECEIDCLDAVFADPDLLEEGLVVYAPELVWCRRVCIKAVGGDPEGLFEDALCLGLFIGDPCLFFFE